LNELKKHYKFFRLLETVTRLVKPSGGSTITKTDIPKIAAFLGKQPDELEDEIRKTKQEVREIFLDYVG
jgi:hypothetical protein